MPIKIDEFEAFETDDQQLSNPERVLRFLVINRDRAFRAAEISDATGVSENSVHPVLSRLEDRGLVRHKRPYWAVSDLDRVRESFVFGSAAAHLDDELGPESREEWLSAADAAENDEQDDT